MSNSSNQKCVYLDYNGTTPVYPAVLDAMLPYLTEHFGNPSSSHYFGQEPKLAVLRTRQSLLHLIQHNSSKDTGRTVLADPSSIIFTGCGTESNNLAIRLSLLSSQHKADEDSGLLHVVSTNIEHPAITQCLNSYTAQGTLTPKISVTYVTVNEEGIVSIDDVIEAIRPNTALVSIMTANNEVGSIQPVFEIAKLCRERNVLFHTDAAQAVGKIDLRGLANPTVGADMVTVVGHKFGAPKGIAALYIRHNCFNEDGRINPEDGGSVLLMGGGQEGGRRGGTENVPYIVGLGRAADLLLEKRQHPSNPTDIVDGWEYNSLHMEMMRKRLLGSLMQGLEKDPSKSTIVRSNGPSDPKQRLPNTLSVGLKDIRSGELLANIGTIVACSAGSACHSSPTQSISYSSILKALHVPPEYAIGTLRLSVGPDTTEKDVDFAAEVIVKEAKRQLSL
eukprot:CAMPEP_0183712250 /NCGR_PEP_ID=MMETSP0737-20130205/7419_1 /TAXON_ID=385413 /ORGANISM="Thalassiosira miniscula, Strain CCMP1093" /LENGTH=447 /DNA_ID=CAMNT_0025940829 /DNA_START=240 /DNA_END=1583 /DNA_ORIENTATION=+